MSIKGTFHWDEYAYCHKVSEESTEELQAKRNIKTAKEAAFGVSAMAGIAASIHTFGISLIGTAYSIRQLHIIEKQVKILDAELHLRGANIPRVRKRDVAIGATAGTVTSALGLVVFPTAVHDLVGDAFYSVATGSEKHALNVMQTLTLPSAHGAAHGVHDALSSEALCILNGQHIAADPCIGPGYGLGVAATMPAESTVASQAAGYYVNRAADKLVHAF